ncbi:MAG: NAD(P)/FAD-dependent oxidoreductase [Chloroflexota bacterium]
MDTTTGLRRLARPRLLLPLGAAGLGGYLALRAVCNTRRELRPERPPRGGPRIAIVGGGFAGLAAAQRLRHRLGHYGRITLIDRHNYHLFTPLLFQVATSGIDPYDIAYPLRQFAGREGIDFREGTVAGIDLDAKTVHLADGEVTYDYLLLALGSTSNYFGNASAMQNAMPLKTLEDGISIRHHVVDTLEKASRVADPTERREMLTFVVVGGGATGVETAAELAGLLRQVVPVDYPNVDPREARVVVLEVLPKLLGHMSDRLAAEACKRLQAAGVEVWLQTGAKEVGPDYVVTQDGRRFQSRTILWSAGVKAPPLLADLPVPHGKGGSLLVDGYLQVADRPGVYAAGDNAHIADARSGGPVPLLAQAAVQEGTAAGENLARVIRGQPQALFRYRPLGNTLSLGPRVGAIELADRVVIDGLAGLLAWRAIHLVKIPSLRNKVATTLDWVVGYAYDMDMARLDVIPTAEARPGEEKRAA